MNPHVSTPSNEFEQGSIHHFHSDLNELLEQLNLIYKSREGIIHPKFGFCKGILASKKSSFQPIKINYQANE